MEFDLDSASELTLTPEKPNSARSESLFKQLGEVAGTLYVIAFKPEDATGDYKSYGQGTLYTGKYRPAAKYYPRIKSAIDTEAHLTIASQFVDSETDPVLFAGRLSMLSLRGISKRQISRIGFVGQNQETFKKYLANPDLAEPTVTLTTGYRGGLKINPLSQLKYTDRFGDPHAILNDAEPPTIQVCGFIGMPKETESPMLDRMIFKSLHAVEPRLGK